MQSGYRQRAAGLDLARDIAVVERTFGLERDKAGLGISLLAFLDRRLQRAQACGVHEYSFRIGYRKSVISNRRSHNTLITVI